VRPRPTWIRYLSPLRFLRSLLCYTCKLQTGLVYGKWAHKARARVASEDESESSPSIAGELASAERMLSWPPHWWRSTVTTNQLRTSVALTSETKLSGSYAYKEFREAHALN